MIKFCFVVQSGSTSKLQVIWSEWSTIKYFMKQYPLHWVEL